ncbi:hypothetical protein MUP79_02030 [Candidatus Bathyarchaeota archaeon]|jgi:hypothetical protein|nr:hypothetical protein [Candidatus Bathyarchaeota archaeon]
MKHENRLFKSGMFIALSVEICVLWVLVFEALSEFDPTHVETIGVGAAILSAVIASSVLLVSLFLVLRWKGQ